MDSTVAAGRREGCIHSKIFGVFHTGGMHGIQKCLISLLVDGFTQIADGAMAQLMQIIHTGPGGIIAAAQNLIHGEFPLLQTYANQMAVHALQPPDGFFIGSAEDDRCMGPVFLPWDVIRAHFCDGVLVTQMEPIFQRFNFYLMHQLGEERIQMRT